MQDIRRVDVLEATERLVDEALEVRVRQRLAGADLQSARPTPTHDSMQVRLHQLLIQVHLVKHAGSGRVEYNVHVVQAGVSGPPRPTK